MLRIEDTDVERSSWDMVEGILQSLRWLGLDWDEGPGIEGPRGPYFQSQRLDRHRAAAARLLAGGHAYSCYCDAEALRREREDAQAAGREWKYDRRCLRLTDEDTARRERAGTPRAVRFLVPPGRTRFADVVHGPIEFEHDHIEDFVLLRSDNHPTYQLSVVIDDVEMGITHVVRGDDHISNTPKQVLLYGALDAPLPVFAHVPLILGPDKKRLSKRHGATSVTEYERLGYLPEAMVNFLALLGWSPGPTDEEIFSREDLVRRFSLDAISGSSAVFNPEKLDWFNAQHIARLPGEELARRVEPLLVAASLWRKEYGGDEREWFMRALDLLKPRVRRLDDFATQGRYLFSDEVSYDPAAVEQHLTRALAGHIAALAEVLARVDPFEPAAIESALRAVADTRQIKAAPLIHATRVAVTGQAVSPGLFDVLAVLGRSRTVARLRALERFLT